MNNPTAPKTFSPLLSFPEVIRSRQPRAMLEQRLIATLKMHLAEFKIVWSPQAFRGGLGNPKLPLSLLKKLDSLITLAEALDWKLSNIARDELNITVEDIETFNPPFRASLKRASADVARGRFVTQEELERRYGIAKR